MVSIIIPARNEEETIGHVVGRCLIAVNPVQIIVVDDHSTDKTAETAERHGATVMLSEARGMWAAIRTGLKEAKGQIIVLFDADLEMLPEDIPHVINPIEKRIADVVYGNRFAASGYRYLDTATHRNGNRLLTILNGIFTNRDWGDEACGFRAFNRKVADALVLKEDGFGGTHEFNARVKSYDIIEVPVFYKPRSIQQGKKIRLWHGLEAIWCMIKYNWLGR